MASDPSPVPPRPVLINPLPTTGAVPPEEEVTVTPPPPSPPHPPSEEPDWAAAREAVRAVSNKWVIPVIAALTSGPLRYGEIHRAIGPAISQKVLAETLHHMQDTRLLSKEEAAAAPTAAPYELTELARSLIEPLSALARWHARAIAG